MVDRFGNPEDRPGLFDGDRADLQGFREQLSEIELSDWIERQEGDEHMNAAVVAARGARDAIAAAELLLGCAFDAIPSA